LGKIGQSKYVTLKTSKKVTLSSDSPFYYHIDGDAKGTTHHIKIDILHKALKIIVKLYCGGKRYGKY
jgi:diacylglycerol kinase family enzyme